jgi:hypothetical protein
MHNCTTQNIVRVMLLACALLTGCNSKRALIPISGQVKIDGKPLETGQVMVWVKDYRPATGKIGKDGRFSLKTYKDGDGCAAGMHRVTVSSRKFIGNSTQYFIPERYENVNNAGLNVKVDVPRDDFNIDLTWKGDAHRGPYIVQ